MKSQWPPAAAPGRRFWFLRGRCLRVSAVVAVVVLLVLTVTVFTTNRAARSDSDASDARKILSGDYTNDIPKDLSNFHCRLAARAGVRAPESNHGEHHQDANNTESAAELPPVGSVAPPRGVLIGDSSALRWFYGIVRNAQEKVCSSSYAVADRLRHAPPKMSCNLTFSSAGGANVSAEHGEAKRRHNEMLGGSLAVQVDFVKARFLPELLEVLQDEAHARNASDCDWQYQHVSRPTKLFVSMGLWDIKNGHFVKLESRSVVEAAFHFSAYLDAHRHAFHDVFKLLASSSETPAHCNSASPSSGSRADSRRISIAFREVPKMNCSAIRFDENRDVCLGTMQVLVRLYNRFFESVMAATSSAIRHLFLERLLLPAPDSKICTMPDGIHFEVEASSSRCLLWELWSFWQWLIPKSSNQKC